MPVTKSVTEVHAPFLCLCHAPLLHAVRLPEGPVSDLLLRALCAMRIGRGSTPSNKHPSQILTGSNQAKCPALLQRHSASEQVCESIAAIAATLGHTVLEGRGWRRGLSAYPRRRALCNSALLLVFVSFLCSLALFFAFLFVISIHKTPMTTGLPSRHSHSASIRFFINIPEGAERTHFVSLH